MSSGRLTAALSVAALLVGMPAVMAASPVSLHPKSVQVSNGSVTITRSSVDDGQELDYTVAFVGPLKIHGWTYTGRLSGSSSAVLWETFYGSIPNFDVSTADGRVKGQCGGGPDNPVDENTGEDLSDPLNRHGFAFDCVLALDGGTPWQVTIRAQTKESTSGPSTTFTGTYRVVDTETSLIGLDEDVTYGDAQLTEYTDDGGGVQWGPLRFSGQLMIGSVRYQGDLVSDVGPYLYGSPIPAMNMTGSGGGLSVSGSCTDTPPGAVSLVIGQAERSYDWECQLAVNGGTPSTVLLRTIFTGGGGRCSGRQCWGDYSGFFTNQ